MFSGKRILVTGATGLIGSNLVKALLEENAVVIAQGRTEEKLKYVFEKELESKSLRYIVGNITEGISDIVEKVDFIFHAASPISGAEIKERPVDTICANINGTINCFEYLKKQGHGRMIVFSSATVYANINCDDRLVSETDTQIANPLDNRASSYSESKRMVEVIARAYNEQYAVEMVIARISYVYGYSCFKPVTAFYEFIANAIGGEDIVINNSGMARRDNIHVSDVVKGLLLVAVKGENGEVYNISSEGDLDNYKAIDELAIEIAKAANQITGKQVRVIMKEKEKKRYSGILLGNEKIKGLGWNVSKSIEEGIFETVKLYKEQLRNGKD